MNPASLEDHPIDSNYTLKHGASRKWQVLDMRCGVNPAPLDYHPINSNCIKHRAFRKAQVLDMRGAG